MKLMSKSTSPGADKAQGTEGRRQEATRQPRNQISYINLHITTRWEKQKQSLSAAVCLGSFHYHFPRFSYSHFHLPYSIFVICICSSTLFLLHALTPFARVGQQLPPQQTHRPTLLETQNSEGDADVERDSYANAPYANLPGHMIGFFSFFPLPLLFIMNY